MRRRWQALLENKLGAILDYIDSNEMKQKLVNKVLERHIYNLERDPNSMATKKIYSTLFRKDSRALVFQKTSQRE